MAIQVVYLMIILQTKILQTKINNLFKDLFINR